MKIKLKDLTFEQFLQYCRECHNVRDCPFAECKYACCPFDGYTPGELYDGIDIEKEIEIDVAPVVPAKFIISDDGFIRCSACGKDIRYPLVSFSDINYCPRCGAKMDGKENDNETR